MQSNHVTRAQVSEFEAQLRREEKSAATIEKYVRYANAFLRFLGGRPLTKESAIAYKEWVSASYTACGANGMLAAVNSFFAFLKRADCRLRPLKVQRGLFLPPERELTRSDLERLLHAAQSQGKLRIALVMQTIFATGIRVGELRFITVEAARRARADVRFKGKTRTVFLTEKICGKLLKYAKQNGVLNGPVFVSAGKRPLDRSNIWAEMKRLCRGANVEEERVFPHNLRHLFARTYYESIPNLAELADLMGHSDVNTTRIYTATTGAELQKRLDRLNLVT